jgi:type I restriction enzyme S subunit
MSEQKNLVPKMRFPEFRRAEGWEEKALGSVCNSFSGGTPNTSKPEYYGGDIPFIRSAEIARDSTELFLTREGLANSSAKMVIAGNILVALYGANSGDVAIAKIDGAINQAILCLKSEESNAFIYQFLSFKKDWIVATYIQGGQGNLSGEIVKSIAVAFPSLTEQQKIADCLSSLDELIAAQAHKVEALKTHKKGLMQQLFPREGETQPRLRFPEFRSAVDWEKGKLITLSSEPLSNGVFNDPKKAGAGYKLINVSDMYIETTIDENRLSLLEISQSEFEGNQVFTGDIFFTRSSLVKSGIAVSNIYLGSSSDVTYDGHLIRFRANISKVIPLFAHYLFKTLLIRAQLIARGKTATMTTIGQADVASVTLFYPKPDEQQRIADCLTSLDDLIVAATREIDNLKTHKKGLMQQLFPLAEAVEA